MRAAGQVLAAGALLLGACSSAPSPEPETTSSAPSPQSVTLRVIAQAEIAYGDDVGQFTVPPGTTELTMSTSCTRTDDGVGRPRVTFKIDTGTPGDNVLTSVVNCGGSGESTVSLDLPPDAPSSLTYRVRPSNPLGISWSLSVAS
jgi:hypothetical protein